MQIFQVYDGAIHGVLFLVDHRSANRAQFGFLTLAVALRKHHGGSHRRRHHSDDGGESELPGRVHGFPPASGSIWSVKSSRLPSRASTLRVCGLKPRASTVNSYSAPCFTRMPSSPWWSDSASQRNFCSSARRTRARAPGKANPCVVKIVAKMTKSCAWGLPEFCARAGGAGAEAATVEQARIADSRISGEITRARF